MNKEHGPLLTDKEFFGICLNTDLCGLEPLKDAVISENYELCREIFADYVRKSLKCEVYFSCLPSSKNLSTEDILSKAELAMKHIMTSCKISHDFGNGSVDWFSNPTYNGYREWTWQLSRHAELLTLARAYRLTKEEKYAKECCNLFDSWVKQATRYSINDNNSEKLCWRSIECGIRMSIVWPEIIHSIIDSDSCSSDIITDFFKSVYEHAALLRNFHKPKGNWLIMEMSGLLHTAAIYTFFKDSEEWYAYAENMLKEELNKQVYPDGFQFELSSSYQQILVIHYGRVIRLLRGYGKKVPEEFENDLKKILHIYVKLMRPNMALPDINDGTLQKVADRIEPYIDLVPGDTVLKWIISEGKEGEMPSEKSVVLPYAGIAVFRTGWDKDDTWLCFDGGPFGAGHQHEDKLNVLLHACGKYILTEGNNYAYDGSDMRRYVLSTRAHNTALVDGMEQNRRKTYCWSGEMINMHSGLQAALSECVDSCRAVYNEGYGADQDKNVTHERSVYFLKKVKGLPPFALIVDRLTAASGTHTYELQYHLDADKVITYGLNAAADSLKILASGKLGENAFLSLGCGIKDPKWNGWTANSAIQDDYRPIYILKYILHGQNVRFITLLLPVKSENSVITGVEGSTQISDTKIVIKLNDGSEVCFDENEWLKRLPENE